MKKQYAALPFKIKMGAPVILLITTKKKGVWSIPKGSPIAGRRPWETAQIEAFEEAGVTGWVSGERLATFQKGKSRRRKSERQIDIYPLEVSQDLTSWPESRERCRRWVTSKEAIRKVHCKSLQRALRSISARGLIPRQKDSQDPDE